MIKIVSCFWNAENYLPNCIKTLKSQKNVDFEVYLIDDMSTDNSVDVIKKLTESDSRFKLIVNTEKKFKLKNLDDLIDTFDDEDIVVELDGDDCWVATMNETDGSGFMKTSPFQHYCNDVRVPLMACAVQEVVGMGGSGY